MEETKYSKSPAHRDTIAVMHRAGGILLLVGLLLAAGGCSSPSMQPGDLTLVQTHSDKPHVGNVYLLRGFIGIWSTGIDAMGKEINDAGIRANVYRNEQWKELRDVLLEKYKDQKVYEPLVIMGHSWGADHAIDIARALDEANITVDLIITLDPVTPEAVPKNVKWCYNIYQTNGIWQSVPIFRGVPLEQQADAAGKGLLQNLNIRVDRTDLLEPDTDHYNIEKNVKVHAEVMKPLLKVCVDRPSWVRAHPGYRPPVNAVIPPAGTNVANSGTSAVTAGHMTTTAPSAVPAGKPVVAPIPSSGANKPTPAVKSVVTQSALDRAFAEPLTGASAR